MKAILGIVFSTVVLCSTHAANADIKREIKKFFSNPTQSFKSLLQGRIVFQTGGKRYVYVDVGANMAVLDLGFARIKSTKLRKRLLQAGCLYASGGDVQKCSKDVIDREIRAYIETQFERDYPAGHDGCRIRPQPCVCRNSGSAGFLWHRKPQVRALLPLRQIRCGEQRCYVFKEWNRSLLRDQNRWSRSFPAGRWRRGNNTTVWEAGYSA